MSDGTTHSTTNDTTDPLLDHEYDGIREYDNPMPGWWVWMFILTTLFAVPYVMWYGMGLGPSIHDNLEAEQVAFAEQLMAMYGDLEADQPTIITYMNEDAAMIGMSSLFKNKCAQCHRADGRGEVGPNLTDDYWVHVNTIVDIAEVIETGRDDKGMPAWGDKLSKTQIVLLSSYVAQLRRQPLEGKDPEGKEIAPWPDEAPGETPDASDNGGDT